MLIDADSLHKQPLDVVDFIEILLVLLVQLFELIVDRLPGLHVEAFQSVRSGVLCRVTFGNLLVDLSRLGHVLGELQGPVSLGHFLLDLALLGRIQALGSVLGFELRRELLHGLRFAVAPLPLLTADVGAETAQPVLGGVRVILLELL